MLKKEQEVDSDSDDDDTSNMQVIITFPYVADYMVN